MPSLRSKYSKKIKELQTENEQLRRLLHHFDCISRILNQTPILKRSHRLHLVLFALRNRIISTGENELYYPLD